MMPARWVVADTVYGTARGLRGWLEERGCYYVVAVPETRGVYHEGRQRQAQMVAGTLPEEAWIRASAGAGSRGDRLYDWACLALPDEPVSETSPVGTGRWLLMRRGIEDPTEYAYYLAYGPAETPVKELIRIAGRRWAIEVCQAQYTFRHGETFLSYHRSRRAIRAARDGGEARSRPRIRTKGRPDVSRGAVPPRP